MNRFRLATLATVSVFALLTAATASQAVTPPIMNLGALKPQNKWKIGTVDASGLSYCAMVSNFDKKVVLAVARNVDGFGSIAIDFRERFFEPGAAYEVTLTPEGGRVLRLSARASSDRAIVVQVGQDEEFFNDLGSGSNFKIALPTIQAAFALRGFSNAYGSLVECAGRIAPKAAAVKAPEVEKISLSSIDGKMAEIAPSAGEGDATEADDVKPVSITTPPPVAPVERVADMPLDAERAILSASDAAAYARKNAELQFRLAEVERERDDLSTKLKTAQTETSDVQALRATLSSLQGQVAELTQQKAEDTKILATVRAEKDQAVQKLAKVEGKLAASEKARTELLTQIDTLDRQNKLMQAALSGKEQELSAEKGGTKELAETRARLSSLEREHANEIAQLRKKFEAEAATQVSQRTEDQKMILSLQKQMKEQMTQFDFWKAEHVASVAKTSAVLAPVSNVVYADVAPAAGVAQIEKPLSGNRAAAFLDKIMRHHRPTARRDETPVIPTLTADEKTVIPALATIEPAAGLPTLPTPKVAVAAAPATFSLQNLLMQAGVQNASFTPLRAESGETIYQWTAGRLSGMLERTAASGSISSQVGEYLDRYRKDCPNDISIEQGLTETTPTGTLTQATASCTMPNNAYRVSFVFLREEEAFTSIMHTGLPADAARVKAVGNAVAQRVKTSGSVSLDGLSKPPARAQATVTSVNYEEGGDDGFKTLIVQ